MVEGLRFVGIGYTLGGILFSMIILHLHLEQSWVIFQSYYFFQVRTWSLEIGLLAFSYYLVSAGAGMKTWFSLRQV